MRHFCNIKFEDRILRISEVCKLTGLSRATIYRLKAAGDFPAPVRLSARAVGWRLCDIMEWIEQRAEQAVRAIGYGQLP